MTVQTLSPPSARDERTIVGAFRRLGALTGPTAQPLSALGLGNSGALRRMVDEAVIRRAGPHRYYLDEGVWTNRGVKWRHIVRGLVVAGLATAGAVLYVAMR